MKIYDMSANRKIHLVFWVDDHKEKYAYLDAKGKEMGKTAFAGCYRLSVAEWVNPLNLPLTFESSLQEYHEEPIPADDSDIILINVLCSFALSPRACAVLQPFLAGNVEELHFVLPESHQHYRCFNVINVPDALDEELSASDNIDYIKYAFKPEVVKDLRMFQDKRFGSFGVLVQQDFVDCVLANSLSNFMFELLWDSDDPDYMWDLKRHPKRPKHIYGRRTKALRQRDDAWMAEMLAKTRIRS